METGCSFGRFVTIRLHGVTFQKTVKILKRTIMFCELWAKGPDDDEK